MKTNILNIPGLKIRIKELMIDFLFIWGYLSVLFAGMMLFYFVVSKGMPEFTPSQSQIIATMTSVVPLILIFTVMEGKAPYGSYGKRKMNVKVIYKGHEKIGSLIRNILKFLPWQFGHMSTISGLYDGFDRPFSILFFSLSMILSVLYILTAVYSKNNRHIVDWLAGSTVIHNE